MAAPAHATPVLFDRALLRLRQVRARKQGAVTFLLDRVAEDFSDRLAAVKRKFSAVADLWTPGELPLPAHASVMRVALDESETLPFAAESLDLVTSALALQFVNDLPGVSPRVTPFADLRDVGQLLQRAGLALPVTDVDRVVVRYDNAFALMHDLRRMGATNILFERRRKPTRRATMLRMAQIYSQRFADPDGRIRATFDIVWLSAWAPHESQQKPLRPGSAKASLEEAVKRGKR
jgi:hypothetical protein